VLRCGAPQSTHATIVNTLNAEINAALADASMKKRLIDMGGMLMPGSGGDFGRLIADETEKWAKVIRAANNVRP
jgi:tripartite-type tricarboxylate transporter receptor subunit TctC